MRRPVSISLYVALAIEGAAIGVVGAFFHAADLDVVGATLPYGILLAIGASVGVFWLARMIAPSPRAGVLITGAAWLVTVLPLSSERPEGDVILPGSDIRSYAFLFLPALAAAALATLPSPGRNAGDAGIGSME